MSNPPDPLTSARRPPRGLRRLHAALMPDYNAGAATYWWTLVALGGGALLMGLVQLAGLAWTLQVQVLFGCAVAMLAGLFPVRIPGSKNSFAAGEVFILLLLLMQGPAAAAVAAACEAFIGATRSSKRWTSRLVSPAAAALSMTAVGTVVHMLVLRVQDGSSVGAALVMLLVIVVGVCHFLLNTLLITAVMHFKRKEPLRLSAFLASFGWVGTTYAVTADLSGFAADKLVMNQKLEANALKKMKALFAA